VTDGTELARKLLSAVFRTGQRYGIGYVEKVLTGSGEAQVTERGHDQLSVFGIVNPDEAVLIRPLARALQARGALLPTEHGGLMLGGDARAILKGDLPVNLVVPPRREKTGRRKGAAGGSAANPVGDPLFDALRNLRRELAQEAGVPPYVVFHDSVLRDMAAIRPGSLDDLGRIGGVGARKLEAYGDAFLSLIRQF
jgi:ATP-dependent DNA helicase RecQ